MCKGRKREAARGSRFSGDCLLGNLGREDDGFIGTAAAQKKGCGVRRRAISSPQRLTSVLQHW